MLLMKKKQQQQQQQNANMNAILTSSFLIKYKDTKKVKKQTIIITQ
jgi:hypothetical protein